MAQWWAEFILVTIRAATPLTLAALGVLLAERSGVLHIGVEGAMLMGALGGVLGMVYGGGPWAGVAFTIVAGVLAGLLLAYISVALPADQVVVGIAFNLASLGLTSFIFRLTSSQAQVVLPPIPPLVLGLSPFSIAAMLMTVLVWFFLFRTGPGLMLRSCGENAHGAHAGGIDVVAVRAVTLVVAAILSALGGAALTIGWVSSFIDNVTLGRGFIALAAVYLGRWNPFLAAGACIVFGAGEALAFRAQGIGLGLNPHYYLMLPYILTLIVVGLIGQAHGPRDAGKLFVRR